MVEIREYVDILGRNFVKRWYQTLDATTLLRISAALARMEEGNFSAAKSVGAGVSEMRLNFGPGYRVYFGKDGPTLVLLLCGGSKKRQNDDIKEAHLLWQEYIRRKETNS